MLAVTVLSRNTNRLVEFAVLKNVQKHICERNKKTIAS